MTTGANDFYYSNKYCDDEYEYRHVHVTKEVCFGKWINHRILHFELFLDFEMQNVHFWK